MARNRARRRGPCAPRDRQAPRIGLGHDRAWIDRGRGRGRGPGDPDFATERIEPRRPLPVDRFRRLGGDPLDAVLAVVRVRQPYYDASHPPEPAVVPGR